MAGAVRLELTTCGFGDRCSSQLSYTPIRNRSFLRSDPAFRHIDNDFCFSKMLNDGIPAIAPCGAARKKILSQRVSL